MVAKWILSMIHNMNTTRELSETGATYDCVLGYGEYEIGAQIPEGTYEVELVSGEGSMQ